MAASAQMQESIKYFASHGFRIQSQSDTQVQMLKPKNRSCFFVGLLLLLGIIPGIFYLLLTSDKSVLLTDLGNGIQVSYNNRKPRLVSYDELDAGKYTKLHKFISPFVILLLIIIAMIALLIFLASNSGSTVESTQTVTKSAILLVTSL